MRMGLDDKQREVLNLLVSVSRRLEEKSFSIAKFFKAYNCELFDNILWDIDQSIAGIIGSDITTETVSDYLFDAYNNDKSIDETVNGLLNIKTFFNNNV